MAGAEFWTILVAFQLFITFSVWSPHQRSSTAQLHRMAKSIFLNSFVRRILGQFWHFFLCLAELPDFGSWLQGFSLVCLCFFMLLMIPPLLCCSFVVIACWVVSSLRRPWCFFLERISHSIPIQVMRCLFLL